MAFWFTLMLSSWLFMAFLDLFGPCPSLEMLGGLPRAGGAALRLRAGELRRPKALPSPRGDRRGRREDRLAPAGPAPHALCGRGGAQIQAGAPKRAKTGRFSQFFVDVRGFSGLSGLFQRPRGSQRACRTPPMMLEEHLAIIEDQLTLAVASKSLKRRGNGWKLVEDLGEMTDFRIF